MEMEISARLSNEIAVTAQYPHPQESREKKQILLDTINNVFMVVAMMIGIMVYNQAVNPSTELREADSKNDGGSSRFSAKEQDGPTLGLLELVRVIAQWLPRSNEWD